MMRVECGMNLNKAIIAGRLTGDPILRQTASGQPVASFSMATNRVWTDKAGAKQEEVEYHNIVVWGRQAEIASKFLTKGALVLVEGRLQTRAWDDKQGQKRKTTEIVCERMQFGPRSSGSFASANQSPVIGGNFVSPSVPRASEEIQKAPDLPVIEVEEDIKAEDLPF